MKPLCFIGRLCCEGFFAILFFVWLVCYVTVAAWRKITKGERADGQYDEDEL